MPKVEKSQGKSLSDFLEGHGINYFPHLFEVCDTCSLDEVYHGTHECLSCLLKKQEEMALNLPHEDFPILLDRRPVLTLKKTKTEMPLVPKPDLSFETTPADDLKEEEQLKPLPLPVLKPRRRRRQILRGSKEHPVPVSSDHDPIVISSDHACGSEEYTPIKSFPTAALIE